MLPKLKMKLRSFKYWILSYKNYRSLEDWLLGINEQSPTLEELDTYIETQLAEKWTPPKRGLTWEQQVVRQYRLRLDKMNEELEGEA